MASQTARMIRHAADHGPRTRIAVQDGWTAIRPARTIIQDWRITPGDAIRVPGRAPAARTALWGAWR